MRLGRLIGGVVGGFFGGPAGAAFGFQMGSQVDNASRSRRETRRNNEEQQAAYRNESQRVEAQQKKINAQLESSRLKNQRGVARSARSRIRGGIFGEQSPAPGLSANLG